MTAVPRKELAMHSISLIAMSRAGALEAPRGTDVAWLLLRGRAEVRAREGDFTLVPGDWIALPRDSASLAVAGAGALLLGIGVAGDEGPERTAPIPGRGRMARGARARAFRTWSRQGALATRGREWMQPAIGDGADARALLWDLQADLVEGIDRCPGHSPRRKRQVLLRMQRARLYLEGQAGNGVRIAELARHINFSPWYFSKVFHALYGIGPLQFATRARLEQASRLLAGTRLPVIEVSASCGFDNPCSFARAFRAHFGMTASEHRLRHGSAR